MSGCQPAARGSTSKEVRWIRPLLAALVAAVILSLPATAGAARAHSAEYRAAVRCNNGSIDACLIRASVRHRVPYGLLRAIAYCESRLDPEAHNPSSSAGGLLQFLASTWANLPRRYSRHSRFEAKWSALAGAWLIRRVGTGPWTASRRCWAYT